MNTLPPLRELSSERPVPQVPDHELLRCIGRGSYGEVWLAKTALGTFRAVKVVYRDDFEEARPYEREYSGIRKYEPVSRSHPGLVDVLQVGRNDAEGCFYYVMELADDVGEGRSKKGEGRKGEGGESGAGAPHSRMLREGDCSEACCPVSAGGGTPPDRTAISEPGAYSPRTLSAERRRRGRLSGGECVELGVLLSAALAELHRVGLIHRDIKPSNIIFVGGVPKLADIGLVTDAAESGSYVGTEGFIPPEGPNSPQADVYSLGKVLYEVSMGKDRLDFPEPASELDDLPDREILRELNSILIKACQPDRRARYASAEAMHAELDLLRRGKSIRDRRRDERRLRGLMVGAAGLLVLVLAVLGTEQVMEWRSRALQGTSSLVRPALQGSIEPRGPGLPDTLIDLSAVYNAPLGEPWYPGPEENTLASLPTGRQTLAATEFDVRGLVQLTGREISDYGAYAYPSRVGSIRVGRWVERLHFLHGAVSEVADGTRIGSYRIYFNTGREQVVPVVYGRNVRALWQRRDESGLVPEAVLAWSGVNAATEARGMELRLYKLTRENPWPGEEMVAVEFSSADANAAPFLVALTVDDAPVDPERERISGGLTQLLQEAASGFAELHPGAGSSEWTRLRLNLEPVEIGGRFYDGFRFTVPDTGTGDLVWAYRAGVVHFDSWFIQPMEGGIKVGFEDWYHVGVGRSGNGGGDRFVVQYLDGRKLDAGREYFIWFGGDSSEPSELEVRFKLVMAGVDSDRPEALLELLGVRPEGEVTFHRHYCLGAMR